MTQNKFPHVTGTACRAPTNVVRMNTTSTNVVRMNTASTNVGRMNPTPTEAARTNAIPPNAAQTQQKLPNRCSIRLREFDYTQPGGYFITICTQLRSNLFGEVVDDKMELSDYGKIVRECWMAIPTHFLHFDLDEFVVMPNHVHGIIIIVDPVGARHAVPGTHIQTEHFSKPVSGSIPTVIRSFKSVVTKQINKSQNFPPHPIWQRSFHEHIVRDDAEMERIRNYIVENPMQWNHDRENPFAKLRTHGVSEEASPWNV